MWSVAVNVIEFASVEGVPQVGEGILLCRPRRVLGLRSRGSGVGWEADGLTRRLAVHSRNFFP